MALLKTLEGRKIVEQVTLKNVKLGVGHDRMGMVADVYFCKKKIAEFNDDGYGGETEIDYITPLHKKAFEEFLIKNNVAQLMFDNGWDFMKSPDRIDLHSQAEEVINSAVNLMEEKKADKKIEKNCLKGIFRKTADGYSGISFKIPLKAVLLHKDGLALLQKTYDRVKSELKEGETIANKNLEELGVKL